MKHLPCSLRSPTLLLARPVVPSNGFFPLPTLTPKKLVLAKQFGPVTFGTPLSCTFSRLRPVLLRFLPLEFEGRPFLWGRGLLFLLLRSSVCWLLLVELGFRPVLFQDFVWLSERQTGHIPGLLIGCEVVLWVLYLWRGWECNWWEKWRNNFIRNQVLEFLRKIEKSGKK